MTIPSNLQSPKPIAAKPSTCSLAAYDGPDLALRQENGVCDFDLPIFLPEPVPDAQTAHATLLLRVLGSLPSDPHQVIGHLSDRLRYSGCLLRALWDLLLLGLDWPILHTLLGKVGLVFRLVTVALGASVSHTLSLFDKAQGSKQLVGLFGHEYSLLLAQVLLETARQMTDFVPDSPNSGVSYLASWCTSWSRSPYSASQPNRFI